MPKVEIKEANLNNATYTLRGGKYLGPKTVNINTLLNRVRVKEKKINKVNLLGLLSLLILISGLIVF